MPRLRLVTFPFNSFMRVHTDIVISQCHYMSVTLQTVQRSLDFSRDAGQRAFALATNLFEVPGVKLLSFDRHEVTVIKEGDTRWEDIEMDIASAVARVLYKPGEQVEIYRREKVPGESHRYWRVDRGLIEVSLLQPHPQGFPG